MSIKRGILLINTGTPNSPNWGHVWSYLREFLMDPFVLNIPTFFRWILVNVIIVPFRAAKSARAYKLIWTNRGSPLKFHSLDLAEKVQKLMPNHLVRVAMRYQHPTIESELIFLYKHGVKDVTIVPMFPQYSLAATESAVSLTKELVKEKFPQMTLKIVGDFYEDPGFIAAQADLVKTAMASFSPDHVLMSYHGLPENHVQATDPSKTHCLKAANCCASITAANRKCYRAQCYATSRALASSLNLMTESYSVSFQSRLGNTPWIQPFTDVILSELRGRGIKRLMVVCPSFVADCLETIEEIGIRASTDWLALGGEAFEFVPCVNASERFAEGVRAMVESEA